MDSIKKLTTSYPPTLSTQPKPLKPNTMSYKSRVCKNGKSCRFLASGKCTFAHPEMGEQVRTANKVMAFDPQQTRRKTVLCRNYPQCNFGDRCTFIHPDVPTLRRSEQVPDLTAFEKLSVLRKRSLSVESAVSMGSDASIQDATPGDFDTMEVLKRKFGGGEDYIGSWHDCSVKRDFQCGPASSKKIKT